MAVRILQSEIGFDALGGCFQKNANQSRSDLSNPDPGRLLKRSVVFPNLAFCEGTGRLVSGVFGPLVGLGGCGLQWFFSGFARRRQFRESDQGLPRT